MPVLFRLLSGAKTQKNKALKLELREEVSVACAEKKDEFDYGHRRG